MFSNSGLRFQVRFLAVFLAIAITSGSYAAIIINEFQYDDTGTADDREFIELYNSDLVNSVSIAGWTISGRDPSGANSSTTLPAGAMIGPGGFYVVGNTGVLNVSHTVAAGFLENDNETIELKDGGGALIDALAYETNKGVTFAAPVASEVGTGVFGNHQGPDLAGTPLNSSVSMGRFVNGRDSNNNGRDFGLRPSTPGTTNSPGGFMTNYDVPDPTSLTLGTNISNMVGSFVTPRVIDPTFVDTNNPNAIPAPPASAGTSKAYVAWDPSGGGNGATSLAVYDTTQSEFAITAYFDTRDLPVQINSAVPPVEFRGAEVTVYGIGSGDALTNLTDISTNVGLASVTLPAAESASGFTGVAWVYEKVGLSPPSPGAGTVSEMLYLVDANDGGDSDTGGNTPLDWTIIASFDMSTLASDWYALSISIDPLGNGVAVFGSNTINFTTSPLLNGAAFNVGYRENLQQGTDGTPDAILRPATFTVPEPTSWIALLFSAVGVRLVRRRRPA